ncbi:MAG: hypothetical protein GC191_04665 [Azospirillum sp.]|nr:hypothetical protein [Azospirillum sp.]
MNGDSGLPPGGRDREADADAVAAWADAAGRLSELLWQPGRLIVAAIRHHSPICARAVAAVIRDRRPGHVLVEGPAEFTPLIPWLLHPETRTPVAIFVLKPAEEPGGGHRVGAAGAGYFPLYDGSPELVALRRGAEIGASLAFIDRGFCSRSEEAGTGVGSLMEESRWRRGRFARALVERVGARNVDEVWDRLFESADGGDPRRLFAEVAAYGLALRRDSPDALLEGDGTRARERTMAAAIRGALDQGGEVLAVMGAFHAEAVAAAALGAEPVAAAPGQPGRPFLIRFSFDRLDALNGYAAGMPAPAWLQAQWESGPARDQPPDREAVATAFLGELAAWARDHVVQSPVATPDLVAALTQARGLAQLRGHGAIQRADLLDAIGSTWIKGCLADEGRMLFAELQRRMAGDRLGEIPAGAGQPPLVAEIRNHAQGLGFDLATTTARQIALEIHRKPRDRERSRFLHALAWLDAGFAGLRAGPDYLNNRNLDRVVEQWRYAWTPDVEGRLVEAARWGGNVGEACLAKLKTAAAALEQRGVEGGSAEAVRLLTILCLVGLPASLRPMVPLVARRIEEDGDIVALVRAAAGLTLLWRGQRGVAGADRGELETLIAAAYHRACWLLPGGAGTTGDGARALAAVLAELQELVSGPWARLSGLTGGLLADAADAVWQGAGSGALLRGAALGLLAGGGRIDEPTLARHLVGWLKGAAAADQVLLVQGLAMVRRELLWTSPDVVAGLDGWMRGLDEAGFLAQLPELRLAFLPLAAAEVGLLAEALARRIGGQVGAGCGMVGPNAEDIVLGARLAAVLAASRAADGLDDWGAA